MISLSRGSLEDSLEGIVFNFYINERALAAVTYCNFERTKPIMATGGACMTQSKVELAKVS